MPRMDISRLVLDFKMMLLDISIRRNVPSKKKFIRNNFSVATLPWESVRMKLTPPKLGLGSPPGLPKFQSSIVRVKTPDIGVFFISLESY